MNNKNAIENRRDRIIKYINEKQRVNITELVQLMDVAEATIRRDLLFLEHEGLLFRVHGGAITKEKISVWMSMDPQARTFIHKEEKQRIALLVSQLILGDEIIMIDGGSTNLYIAEQLKSKKGLTILTNSPTIAEILVSTNNHRIIITGGELYNGVGSLTGTSAELVVNQYRADRAILGTNGIIPGEGFFCPMPEDAALKRLMMKNSRETILVADGSKFECNSFCLVDNFDRVGKLITDDTAPKEAVHELRNQGVEVFVVS
jgi:DeoR family fructose operon transcriptional repressor